MAGSRPASLLDSVTMMRRIDLRGVIPPFDYRAAVPRADFDVEAALHVVRPICEAVRDPRRRGDPGAVRALDGVVRDDIAVPRDALAEALAGSTPTFAPALEESISRLRASCEAERETDAVTTYGPGRPSPIGWCRSAGSASTCPVASRRWSPAW